MKPPIVSIITVMLLTLGSPSFAEEAPVAAEVLLQVKEVHMGTSTEILVWSAHQDRDKVLIAKAFEEMERIEAILTTYRETSNVIEINNASGSIPVKAMPETWDVLTKAMEVWKTSGGAFDITYKPIWNLWKKGLPDTIPSTADIQKTLLMVGSDKMKLDSASHEVFLAKTGMSIDTGGLGKGYIVDRALQVLRDGGIQHAVVNAGGDLRGIGSKGGTPWTTGIRHPRRKTEIIATLPIRNEAIVTSGDYERFIEFHGKRYAHIIDPRTGYPAERMAGVTVIAPTCMEADAWATALFVLGAEEGRKLVDTLPGVEAVFVDTEGRMTFSAGMQPNTKAE